MDHKRFRRATPFILCVDRFDTLGKRVWAVLVQGQWLTKARVDVRVPMTTVFRGAKARNPKAYLRGYCRSLRLVDRKCLVIE